jgi:hypothetical protein
MPIVLVAQSVIPLVAAACGPPLGQPYVPGTPAMSDVYGAMEWYQTRPEPEQLFQGVLHTQELPVGPATRLGLRYVLVTHTGPLDVYAPGDGRVLERFVDQQVVVRAKLVDLSGEGIGNELWIAAIGSISTGS